MPILINQTGQTFRVNTNHRLEVNMESRFRVGDIVKINKRSIWYKDNDSFNPKNIEGIITYISSSNNVTAEWSEGIDNSYKDRDLSLVRRPTEIHGVLASVNEDLRLDVDMPLYTSIAENMPVFNSDDIPF